MTPLGTLYPLDDILRNFPDITVLDWWNDLLPVMVEDDKREETQQKLWAIYEGRGSIPMINMIKPYQIIYNVAQCTTSQFLNNIPDSDVPECDILGGNDIREDKKDNQA